MWSSVLLLGLLLWTNVVTGGSSMLSGLQLSVPVGRAAADASWDRHKDQLHVQQQLTIRLRRMAAEAAMLGKSDDTEQQERARYLNTFMREPLTIIDPDDEDALELSLGGVGARLDGVSVGGMTSYRVEDVTVDLLRHRYSYRLVFERVHVKGEYRLLHHWWGGDAKRGVGGGQLDFILRRVQVNGSGVVDVFDNGTIVPAVGHTHTRSQYDQVDTDLALSDWQVDTPTGAWASLQSLLGVATQSTLKLMAPYIWQALTPYTVELIGDYLARHGSVYVPHLDEHKAQRKQHSDGQQWPFSAIDQLVYQLRQQLQQAGLDPLQLPTLQRQYLGGGVELVLSDGAVTGLSRLHRSGQLQLAPGRGAGEVTFSLGTSRLAGRYRWAVSSGQFRALRRAGSIHFSVDQIKVSVVLRLGSGTGHTADALANWSAASGLRMESMDVHVGELRVESDGDGESGLDYLLSVGVQGVAQTVKEILTTAVQKPLSTVFSQTLLHLVVA